ncbi:MAG: protealysin inhibitor emfourin [Actinomycetota bacterium]
MKIEFQRSGGFAGMILSSTVDTGDLSEVEAREFEELVGRVDIEAVKSASQAAAGGPHRGADRFQYDLKIEAPGSQHQLTISEAQVSFELRSLLDKLEALARKK